MVQSFHCLVTVTAPLNYRPGMNTWLPVETYGSAISERRRRTPLAPIQNVNLRTLDNVFVYSDIVEQSLIGESQASFLGYFPIKSSFGETGYWCFNPLYDYKVIKSFIDTISIKLTQMKEEVFPFKKGKIIIRLLFKRMQWIQTKTFSLCWQVIQAKNNTLKTSHVHSHVTYPRRTTWRDVGKFAYGVCARRLK